MQQMEEARKAHIAAKEKRDEESIAAATGASLHLQGFVFRKSSAGESMSALLTCFYSGCFWYEQVRCLFPGTK